ncbi:MAG TPA: hypothetical protein VF593_07835 [Chthoniobacteraceae bacterium]|jgi:hypothetical protein
MNFDLELDVSSGLYRASSRRLKFEFSGPAVCIGMEISSRDCLLSVGEGESVFAHDPELQRGKSSGEYRVFNPFTLDRFEPRNAANVVGHFVWLAHQTFRSSFARTSFFLIAALLQRNAFIDRCAVTVLIPGFDSLPPETRRTFRSEVLSEPFVTSLAHNGDGQPWIELRVSVSASALLNLTTTGFGS